MNDTIRLYAWFVLLMFALTGCGGPRAVSGLGADTSGINQPVVPLFAATMREPSDNPAVLYSTRRTQKVNFSEIDVGIPLSHRTGTVETSSGNPDPQRHFTIRSYTQIADEQRLISEMNRRLDKKAPRNREIFIFVHGYNNNFPETIFRGAQIVHDYNINSIPLVFAWASGGAIPLYVFDRDSSLVGRNGLAQTIRVAAKTKANRIIILGHSMGAHVVMEALRTLALKGENRTLQRIGGVVLAAPDVDPAVFESQLQDIGKIPQPFTIIISRRDRALGFSRRIAGGHPRVGSGANIATLQRKDITVLDVSQIDGGSHSVFASSQTLIELVGHSQLIRTMLLDEQQKNNAISSGSGDSILEDAAALIVYLPTRILGSIAQPRS